MDQPRNHESTKKTWWVSWFPVFAQAFRSADAALKRCATFCFTCLCLAIWIAAPRAQTDLDAFMRQVLAKRDDNWKKLQQYILDEHESIDLRGPARLPMWGDRRDYTWYIRDGFFIRSPVKANGVVVS